MNILNLFQDAYKQYPEKIAIIDGENTSTYEELDQKSNLIAEFILHKIGPRQPILLVLEPSIEQIIVLLGILKACCYYIPCDVRLTEERLDFILHNSDAKLIISAKDCVFSELFTCNIETININKLSFSASSLTYDLPTPTQHDLAYVIYTSGTTGQPKGVKISHGNLHALFSSTQKVFAFSKNDNWAYVHSYGFDFSVWEIWGALTTGATLILFSYETIISPELFINQLMTQKISVLNQTPSAFYRVNDGLLHRITSQKTVHLRYIIFGGEKLEISNLQPWINFSRNATCPILVNMYGITEGTVHCTFSLVQATYALYGTKSIIGKPLADYQFYLLPIEDMGHELLISGPAVCQGYIKCPDLEKEKFVEIDNRIYFRTGDLIQQLDDQLEYIGRFDDQVKIRGYRITLGEINHYLGANPNVQSAVTLPITRDQDTQLVGFVTLAEQAHGALQHQYQTQISNWEYIYEQLYACNFKQKDYRFNIQGWNNSLTNQPFSPFAMQEWLQDTLEKIRSLQPKSVLEIGCGSGLILFGLLDEIETYSGIDISQQAINQLRALIPQSHVTLYAAEAMHIDAIPDLKNKKFDCIVINSVIQYFPSIQYLSSLLKKLQGFWGSQTCLFLGDIRNYHLLPEYHYYVANHRGQILGQTLEQIREHTYTGVLQEKELLISPDFFQYEAVKALNIANATICLYRKQNSYENELNLFRYDVIIKNAGSQSLSDRRIVYYNETSLSLSQLLEQMDFDKEILIVSCFDRTLNELSSALRSDPSLSLSTARCINTTIPELKKTVEHAQLQARYLLNSKGSSYFEAVFYRGACPDVFSTAPEASSICYANHPIEIEHDLFAHLRKKLPFYAIPSYLHVIDHLPITVHGKVDKRKLKEFHDQQSYLHSFILKEQDATNENKSHVQFVMMAIWKKVLKLKTVDIEDDFFEIGGDSISSLQIIHCCKQAGLQITIRDLFKYRTIRRLLPVMEKQTGTEASLSFPDSHFNLSLIQDWFVQSHQGTIHDYCQTFVMELQPHIDSQIWLNALKTLFANRSIFKLRFKKHDGQWVQYFDTYAAVTIYPEFVAISDSAQMIQRMQLSKAILNIEQGSSTYVHFFVENSRRFCAIAIHHLLFDAISWKYFVDDLCAIYTNYEHYRQQLLRPERMHYAEYVNALNQIPLTHLLDDLNFWLSQIGPNFFAKQKVHYDKTRYLVQSFPIGSRFLPAIDAVALQIASLYLSLCSVKKQEIVLTIEKHGREDFIHSHIESSLGWHTSMFPLKLSFSEQLSYVELVEEIKKLFLAIPHGGVTFLAAKRQGLLPLQADEFHSDISFNFLGNFDNTFDDHAVVKQVSPLIENFNQIDLTSPFTLQVNTVIQNNHLLVHFIYADTITEQVGMLTKQFEKYLGKGIFFNQPVDPYPLTPMQNYLQSFSDFPFQFHQLALVLDAPISRIHLEQALLMILRNHTIFNMCFENGQQYVYTKEKKLAVTEYWAEKVYPECLQDVLLADLQKPFHELDDYLVRLNIIYTNDKTQILLLAYHQYVLDGWALQQFLSLWSANIIALERDCPSLAKSQDFYLKYLEQLPKMKLSLVEPPLAQDRVSALEILRERFGSYRKGPNAYGKVIHKISLDLSDSLQAFCKTQKMTMGTCLMTAFAYFLSGNQAKFIGFKTIESGRQHHEFDHTLGALTRVHLVGVNTEQNFNQSMCDLSNQLLTLQEGRAEIESISEIQEDELVVSFQNFKKIQELSTHFANRNILQFVSWERSNTPMTIRFVPSQDLEIWVGYQEAYFTQAEVKRMCEEFVKNMVERISYGSLAKELDIIS